MDGEGLRSAGNNSARNRAGGVMSTYSIYRWKHQCWKRGNGRWYRCELRQDLFGNWLVVRQWGGVSSGKGGAKETMCKSYAEAEALFAALAKRRERREYVLTGSS